MVNQAKLDVSFLSRALFVKQEKIHPRIHARYLDKYLGYKIPKIELKLLQKYSSYERSVDESNRKQHYQGTQTWIGLNPQILQTPYNDIYEALLLLKEHNISHVVDIGAGYGRVGLVLNSLYPEARFTGFEIIRQRQVEGNRIYEKYGLDQCHLKLQNVLEKDFELPLADIYFIYDFSEKEDVDLILECLAKIKFNKKFFLFIRGDRTDSLIKSKFGHIWKNQILLKNSDLRIIY